MLLIHFGKTSIWCEPERRPKIRNVHERDRYAKDAVGEGDLHLNAKRAEGHRRYFVWRSVPMSENSQPDITTLTVQLLSAFVSNNSVPSETLADLIRTTRAALTDDLSSDAGEAQAATYTPAVSVRKSLSSPEHILSMIDGKPYKTLKRHLATHGLSPDDYRQRYNLPKSYPLVAPSYSEARRAVATRLGLGRKPVPAAAAGAEKAAAPKAADATVKAPKAAAAASGAKAPAAKAKAAKPQPRLRRRLRQSRSKRPRRQKRSRPRKRPASRAPRPPRPRRKQSADRYFLKDARRAVAHKAMARLL
jgi:predicted transcriptional regulator